MDQGLEEEAAGTGCGAPLFLEGFVAFKELAGVEEIDGRAHADLDYTQASLCD